MSENNTTQTTDAVVDEKALASGEIGRDTTMDISSLLKASKEEPEAPKTNLQKMKEAKENGTLGLVVNNDELTDESSKKLITNKSEDDAMKEIDGYLAEQDRLINAAKNVNVVNKPSNAIEMASMITALENVATTGETGTSITDKEMIRVKTEEEMQADAEKSSDETVDGETPTEQKPEVDPERQNIINILILIYFQ